MTDAEAAPFLRCDFVVHEHLHLLAAEVASKPAPTPGVAVSRVRRREYDAVLDLDAAAFPRDWRLGPTGLTDALGATPARQFRASRDAGGTITGYAITGIAGPHGYLQRIAADPRRQREGIGRALVLDGFAYLWSHGASRVYVNTQLGNAAALALYRSCGFQLLNSGLTVLERSW
jgi:ribosomal protein S18 acetylase RimI-like enzyme